MARKSKCDLTPYLKQAGPGRSIRVYRNKEVVYSQANPADAVFYLQSGLIKLTVSSKRRRKKAVLAVLQEGDLFGEGCLGTESHRESTATSIGSSTVTRLERDFFRRKVDREPAFAEMLISCLLSQTARLRADLADQFLNFSDRRLARVLLMYGGSGQKGSGPVTFRFSQSALAEIVGTTRPRISLFMNEFRRKGYLHYNGGVQIDSKLLTAFLEE